MLSPRSGAMCAPPALLLLILSLSACGGGSDGGWSGSVTDSAGVQIVSNPSRGLWNGASPWSFTEELRIGGAGGSPESQFGNVVGIDVDSAGDVYVADQQARHVQVFGPGGRFLHTIGAPGRGPGEIGASMSDVILHGNEVWVPDLANQRIDRFGLDGTSMGSDALDFTQGMPSTWAHSSGGRLITRFQALVMPGMASNPHGDPLVAFELQSRDTVVVLPKGRSVQISRGQARVRLFEPEPLWDAAPDGRILTAMNAVYRIEVRAASGKLVRVITKRYTARKVTASDQKKILDALRKMMLQQGIPSAALDQVLGAVSFAETYPAMQSVRAGPDSTVWVQHVRTAEDLSGASGELDISHMGSDDWDVFEADGRYLGTLTLPPRFRPMLVRGDDFWGVQRDSLDVPSVVRYRLVQGG